MYGEGRIAGVIEVFKRGFSFCERTGAFSLIKTKIVKVPAGCYNTVIDSAIIDGVRGE